MVNMIDPDEEATWPPKVIRLLLDNQELITAYEERERYLSGLSASQHIAAGFPENSYRDKRAGLVSQIDDIVSEFSIIGYHATRLIAHEASNLAGGMLEVLSLELVRRRIDQARSSGFLSAEDAEALLASSLAGDISEPHGKRIGMIWMVFFKSLVCTDGLYRIFRYWGGEATYWAHEESEMGKTLMGIGSPALLQCEVPISDLNAFGPIGERFIAAFMERRDLRCVNGYEFEAYSRKPAKVRRVIAWGTKEFDDLTRHAEWSLQLS